MSTILCSLASTPPNKWGYSILKPTVIPNWLSIKSKGSEVCHEDLISYHQATIKLAKTFDSFYIAICLALKHESRYSSCTCSYIGLVGQHQLPSYGSYSSPLLSKVWFRSQQRSYDFNKLWPSRLRFSIIDYVLHRILPDDPKRLLFDGDFLASIII